MDEAKARLILQAYRPEEKNDPEFADALAEVARNPTLASWFAEEQAFDRAMSSHLEGVPAPFGLKTRILAQGVTPTRRSGARWWALGLAAVAAIFFLFAPVVSMWRTSLSAADLSSDYTREMVSFVRLTPPLEMESKDLGAIKDWLGEKKVGPMEIPHQLSALEPLGCRILSFRQHDVTLICFRREGARLAHLFVVDRVAMPKMKANERPIYSKEGQWMTATWVEKDRIYMLTMQTSRATIEQFVPDA